MKYKTYCDFSESQLSQPRLRISHWYPQQRHSRFKNQTATCSAFRQKKLHFMTQAPQYGGLEGTQAFFSSATFLFSFSYKCFQMFPRMAAPFYRQIHEKQEFKYAAFCARVQFSNLICYLFQLAFLVCNSQKLQNIKLPRVIEHQNHDFSPTFTVSPRP